MKTKQYAVLGNHTPSANIFYAKVELTGSGGGGEDRYIAQRPLTGGKIIHDMREKRTSTEEEASKLLSSW